LKITLKNKNLCCLDVCVGKINVNKCASLVYKLKNLDVFWHFRQKNFIDDDLLAIKCYFKDDNIWARTTTHASSHFTHSTPSVDK
jgi:hypothetical protein